MSCPQKEHCGPGGGPTQTKPPGDESQGPLIIAGRQEPPPQRGAVEGGPGGAAAAPQGMSPRSRWKAKRSSTLGRRCPPCTSAANGSGAIPTGYGTIQTGGPISSGTWGSCCGMPRWPGANTSSRATCGRCSQARPEAATSACPKLTSASTSQGTPTCWKQIRGPSALWCVAPQSAAQWAGGSGLSCS